MTCSRVNGIPVHMILYVIRRNHLLMHIFYTLAYIIKEIKLYEFIKFFLNEYIILEVQKMDNETMMNMFYNMMATMSDQDLENALKKAKMLLNANDYEKLCNTIRKNRPRSK